MLKETELHYERKDVSAEKERRRASQEFHRREMRRHQTMHTKELAKIQELEISSSSELNTGLI